MNAALFVLFAVYLCTAFESSHGFTVKNADYDKITFASAIGKQIDADTVAFQVVNGSKGSLNTGDGDVVVTSILKIDINQTGWAHLTVRATNNFNDITQAYWAGFTEGVVSLDLTKAHYWNTAQNLCQAPLSLYCSQLKTYVIKNWEWMKREVLTNRINSPFWHQIELQMWQLKGLDDAFNGRAISTSKELSLDAFINLEVDPFGIFLMQLSGDLEELSEVLGSTKKRVIGDGSCSALIKVLPKNADLYVSHDTWSEYGSMLRVLKHYNFQFALTADEDSQLIPSNKMSFSSYPSVASSGDDFYLMNSGLATLETTNGNYNTSLWDIVRNGSESSVFEFLRVQVANRLATSGSDWVKYFSDFNSGTYNNQWMIVDYKLFKAGEDLPDSDLLYVAEQLPGLVEAHDMTSQLKNTSYWASYNIPVFQNVFEISGFPSMVNKYGDWFTHEGSPRGRIFKRDHNTVQDIPTMIHLMRYNDYKNDPLSRCNCTPPYSAENAISARCDLNPSDGVYPFGALGHRSHGGIDMKLVNSDLMKSLNFIAICGPTQVDQPAFQWSLSDFNNNTAHVMHPDRFDFPPIQTKFGDK